MPPVSISLILVGYIIMIKHGPTLMESKTPYELKNIMMIYNLFQVVSNLLLWIYVSCQRFPYARHEQLSQLLLSEISFR